jgi:hypothetical protein
LTGGSVKANALTFRSADSTLTFRGKVLVHIIKIEKPEKEGATGEAQAQPTGAPAPEGTAATPEDIGALRGGTQ